MRHAPSASTLAARLLALAGLSAISAPALARPGSAVEICHQQETKPERPIPAYDPATGRDLSTYPPDQVVDFQHMRLVIDIPDMNTPRLSAVQTLSLHTLAEPVPTLVLDAHLLDIQSVAATGHQAKFDNDGRHLTITFDPPLKPGETTEITTAYSVNDPPAGLSWIVESPAWPGRPPQIHSQGESETNSYWFPCHDFPNDRLTTELIVNVPAGYLVSSNGRMVEPVRHSGSGKDARDTFHWLQDKPHVNYLVSLVVGKFDVVDVSGGGPVPMPVYAPLGRGKDVGATYGRTPRMIELFGRLTGQPYPWDRYAQVIVWNFGAGGMENTSATTLYDTAILSPEALGDNDLDGLISHELAHQWFGDLITCRSWEHIWLNEGFATYFTALWMENRDGRDAYQAAIRGEFDAVIGRDKAEAPHAKPMVTHAYTDADDQFGGAANPYPKGASILHMLRQKLGDERFFRGLATYVAQKKLQTAETADFRRVMEDTSGESLLRFFRQWCERPGVPDLDVSLEYTPATQELIVSVKQQQNIDDWNPAFAFDLPVWAGDKKSIHPVGTMHIDTREAAATFKLDGTPSVIAVDPDMAVLAKLTIHQPVERWVSQLDLGPTWSARVQAARALHDDHTPQATAALSRLAHNGREPASLRAEAVEALGARRDAEPLMDLAAEPNLPPDAGVALASAAAKLAGDDKLDGGQRSHMKSIIARMAAEDPSQRVRAEAIRGLGTLKDHDALPTILAAAERDSQSDHVRQAALDALADLDAKEGLQAAIRYSLPGALDRTRPVAIHAVGRLAHFDPDAAYKVLATIVTEREVRAWRTAGAVLADLGDKRALDDFARLEASKRDPNDKKLVAGWAEKLRAKTSQSAAPPGAQDVLWVPVANPDSWAWSDGEKKMIEHDAVGYFKKRGYVTAQKDGSLSLLCWNTPDRLLSTAGDAGASWAVEKASVFTPEPERAAVSFTLDEAGQDAFGGFTEHNLGRAVVVIVDGKAYTAPKIRSRITNNGQITGRYTKAEADALAELLRQPGKLQFRVAVEPGEREDEAKLVERFRKGEN